jgi:hydroxypyruvate isomerase
MNRRNFMQSAGLLATSLAAQNQPVAPARTGIKTTLMLEMLNGSIEEEFELAARAGFQSVESLTQYAAWSDADVERVRSVCRSHHIGVDTILAQQDWKKRPVSMVDPAHRETFLGDVRKAIVYAQKLEIPQVSVNSGLSAAGKTAAEQYASLTEGLKRAADLVAEAKLTLLIEALNSLVDHPGCFLTNNVDALQVVKEVNLPHVRLLFDIYHEQIMRGNLIRTITAAAPHIAVFHVADNPGRNDPGTGEIDYPNVYAAIRKTGFTGYIGMEYHPLGDQLASFTKAVKTVQEVWARPTPV